MRAATLALAAAVMASPTYASNEADVMAAVNRYDNGFNTGDSKVIVGMCSGQAIIIDEFPPYLWQGANACQTWLNDLTTFFKTNGITAGKVTLLKSWHVDVSGDRAYVVVPVKYTYKRNGTPMAETGSVWTVILKRNAHSWVISSWAWAKH